VPPPGTRQYDPSVALSMADVHKRRHARRIWAIVMAAVLALLAGCGEDESDAPAAGTLDQPGAGGTLTWALAERPQEIDPLLADTRAEQLVTRQIHEPLAEDLTVPFGDVQRPGLSPFWRSSAGGARWSFRLRSGVRFQDGTRFNGQAVLANADRWRTTPAGQALLPGLLAADSPRPDLVRFILDRPDPDFPARLKDPRMGIVSPRALDPPSGENAELRRDNRTGTGPFELRESDSDGVVLARNLAWWGTQRDLGPALDQVDFRVVEKVADRVALLSEGDVQVAEALGSEAAAARRDPLLDVLGSGSGTLGLQRSVRGITSASEIPSLSAVWLTRVGAG
jgi:peptide/nickel transport system substrate-binding protein